MTADRIRWGVFRRNGDLHVAPCFSNGQVSDDHQLLKDCACRPRQDSECSSLWVHNDELLSPWHGLYRGVTK